MDAQNPHRSPFSSPSSVDSRPLAPLSRQKDISVAAFRHRISKKLTRLRPERQHDLLQIAEQRKALGLPIYNFALAPYSGALSDSLKQTGIDALNNDDTPSSSPSGLLPLREAVLKWLELENEYAAHNVIISAGARQALLNVFLATCDSGDVVLLGSVPSLSYAPTAQLASTRPVIVQPMTVNTPDLKVRWEDLVKCLEHHPRARVFVLSNPCDPTGQVYRPAEIQALLQVCADHNVYFVLDRRHWRSMLRQQEYPTPILDEGTKPWLIQIDSLSYSFPHTSGLRVGWAVGPCDVMEMIAVIQSHNLAGPSDPSQQIALSALTTPYQNDLSTSINVKYDLFRSLADDIPGVKIFHTEGTCYSFWDVRSLFGRRTPSEQILIDSDDVAEYLLESKGVAAIPGSCFSQDGYLRFSFHVDDEVITEGMAATRDAIAALSF